LELVKAIGVKIYLSVRLYVVPHDKALNVDNVVPEENYHESGQVEVDRPFTEGRSLQVESTVKYEHKDHERLPIMVHIGPQKCEDAAYPTNS
jgi:hypothetical protein